MVLKLDYAMDIRIPGRLVKTWMAGPLHGVSDSVGPECGQRICIADKFLGDIGAGDLRTAF